MNTLLLILALVTTYVGRIVDGNNTPVGYATVYPERIPEAGTATNNEGIFTFDADLQPDDQIIVSFIGYEKLTVNAERLAINENSIPTLVLREQPIALEETVVAAKAGKQKNKRKQLASLLHAVYVQIEADFPDTPMRYQVVSDVKMTDGNAKADADAVWGMEQMIADIVVLPEQGREGRDSVQFQGRFCKRFFASEKRAQADAILAGETIERLEKDQKEKFMRKAVNAVDSGVVIHRTLFSMGNMRYDFQLAMNDLRHWSVSNESEGETVLTHTEKINRYLGCFQIIYQRHYIVDSRTYAVRRFSEHSEIKITIPFGVKLNEDQLQILNLINMSNNRIEQFRLKKMTGHIDFNTIYQRRNEQVYTL